MEHQVIKSSNLASTGYNPQTRVLEIAFSNGSVYEYRDVPPEVVAALREAPSAGGYFAAHIKDLYTTRKIQDAKGGPQSRRVRE